jgi:hypothetical protein
MSKEPVMESESRPSQVGSSAVNWLEARTIVSRLKVVVVVVDDQDDDGDEKVGIPGVIVEGPRKEEGK